MTVTYERHEGPEAARLPGAFLPAYEEVYAEPPYCEGPQDAEAFVGRFRQHAQRPGFRLVLAREGAEVVGFAFGFPLPAEATWWGFMLEPLPPEFTRETGTRTFAVVQLAVRRPWRRCGTAAALHAALLDGAGVERAALHAYPAAGPAQAAYRGWGYVNVGRCRFADGGDEFDALVLTLPRCSGA
ncbi:GNAT family N-acetyltransferase [Streptomyces sp. NPDC049585]|uniref:GNAT family N-acetyltransferase n=1 Tax=Streptomyces sp. NPDC049585 TaxID=3155154 RepID=UPI003441B19E